MLVIMARRWWVVALRGALGVVFGVAALALPELTVKALTLLFGAYVLSDGLVAVLLFARGTDPSRRPRWLLLLEASAGIALGLVTFLWPAITIALLLFLIAVWAIGTGALEIAASRVLRGHRGGALLGLSGVASTVLGAVILAQPELGALALAWLVGGYAIVFGALLVAFALWLRGQHGGRSPGGIDPRSLLAS